MSRFLGEYEVAMDAKGRFLVPSGFRKQLAEGGSVRFVLNRGMDRFVALYTWEEWEKVTARFDKMNGFNPKVEQFKRLFLNGATVVEPDSAGRILVPKPLQKYAGLEKELVFFCNMDKVEIWDKDTYHKYMNDNAAQYAALAQEVMGGNIIDPFN